MPKFGVFTAAHVRYVDRSPKNTCLPYHARLLVSPPGLNHEVWKLLEPGPIWPLLRRAVAIKTARDREEALVWVSKRCKDRPQQHFLMAAAQEARIGQS